MTNISKSKIAIIGMGIRFPGNIYGPDGLWQALLEGRDCITDIPNDRWNIDKYYDSDPNKIGKIRTKKGGFIKGMKEFDAEFFDIYPNVAHSMDPRQRHLLEVTYEAIEDANIKISDLDNSLTAAIIGVFLNDESKKTAGDDINHINSHAVMGGADTTVPARLAYQFNLKGPVLAVDTACSSSLVAIQLACNSIWNGDSKMAIAGGVNFITSHEHNILLSKGGFLNPEGYCKSFDASGNGYVRGEGCAVMIMKPLDNAIKDNNNIYAVISNAVVNFDGHTEDGITVPNEFAQLELLKKAYGDININPKDVDFIEAHGTGTKLGDPKECWAFGNIFSKNRDTDKPLIIGSIKSNIGHTEAVAGVAGLAKLVLSVKNKKIPPNLHFKTPNPAIKFDEWKLKVATKITDWPNNSNNPNKKAIAGVNSFGAGGTNAHIVLEEYITQESPKLEKHNKESNFDFPHIFTLSAKNKDSLKELSKKYLKFIQESEYNLDDICYAITKNRSLFGCRIVIICNDKKELISKLQSYIKDENNSGLITGNFDKENPPKIAFICSGQGPQWYAMGRQLMQKSQIFSDIIKQIDKIFYNLSGCSLSKEMNKSKEDSRISETKIAQPAIMALQIGLIEMWKFFGIKAEGLVGHSIGEVAASYAAGALTLEQAVTVIYYRSKEQDKASGKGSMLATGLTYSKSLQIIKNYQDKISVAAINGPESSVLSGDTNILQNIAKELEEKEIFNRFLKINVPFHSHYMDIVQDEMLKNLKDLKPSKTTIPLYSTVTGIKENGLHLDANYWFNNVRDTVHFTAAIDRMMQDGYNYFIEIAPHPILASGTIDMLQSEKIKREVISSLSRNIDKFENNIEYESQNFLTAIAKTYINNNKVNLEDFYLDKNTNPQKVKSIKLPFYAWQKKEYWLESQQHQESRLKKPTHPFIKKIIKSLMNKNSAIIELDLNPNRETFLSDHKIDGTIVLPATAHLEIATQIGKEIYGKEFSHLEDIKFKKALFLEEDNQIEARLELESSGKYIIYSRENKEKDWVFNSGGKICKKSDKQNFKEEKFDNLTDLRKRIDQKLSVEDFYEQLKKCGLVYGKYFRLIKEIYQKDNEILAKIELPEDHENILDDYNFIPNMSDASLHLMLRYAEDGIYLPDDCKKFKIHNKVNRVIWSYVKILSSNFNFIKANIASYDNQGNNLFHMNNISIKYLKNSNKNLDNIYSSSHIYKWFKYHDKKADIINKNNDIILILSDKNNLYKSIYKKIHQFSKNIIIIKIGKESKLSDNIITINNCDKDHIIKLFSYLKGKDLLPTKIINFWPLDYEFNENYSLDQLLNISKSLFSSILHLFQKISILENDIEIYQITQNADKITQNDTLINPLQSSLYGMGRVFMNEYPNHIIKMIDLPSKLIEKDIDLFISQIFKKNIDKIKTEIAIRDGDIFGRRIIDNSNDKNFQTKKNKIFFKDDVTYLITGGTNGFGLTITQWMFENGARNFALISRSGVKSKNDNNVIQKLINLGANIRYKDLKADITNENEINSIFKIIKNTMPQLKGIIHAAGLINDMSYQNMTMSNFMEIFSPKALGAWNLHKATKNMNLDLFLMTSSVSSFLGITGQSNYSTANNFLDYFSIYRNQKGLKTYSACLGTLSGNIAGMSKVNNDLIEKSYRNIGLIAMSKTNILNRLENFILSNNSYSLLSSIDWKNLINSSPHIKKLDIYKNIIKNSAIEKHDNNKSLSNIDNKDELLILIKDIIVNILSNILGIEEKSIKTNISINNLGLDSLMLNQLRNKIQSEIDINISLMQLSKGLNLEELSRNILNIILNKKDNSSKENTNNPNDNYFTNIKDIKFINDNWFVKQITDNQSKVKIICLHPVGAGASIFGHFIFNPPKNTEIIAIQMPGRENRIDEQNYYNNMDELIKDLSERIITEIDRPVIFWGHSWGGVSLFEVTRYIRKNYPQKYQNIKQLIITASIAPHLTESWKNRDSIKMTAKKDSFDKIITTMSYLEDEKFLRKIFPIMKKDMELIMTYNYKKDQLLDIPIFAFGAIEDSVVLLKEVKEWKNQTNKNFTFHQVRGDHWFLSRNKNLILQKIEEEIYNSIVIEN